MRLHILFATVFTLLSTDCYPQTGWGVHPVHAKYFDVSMSIATDMLIFPGDPPPIITTEVIPFGNTSLTLSKFSMGAHIGTHIDTPAHFLPGAANLDAFPPNRLIGEVFVLDFSSETSRAITKEMLEKKRIPRRSRIFIKTVNSRLLLQTSYHNDHVYIEPDAADHLVQLGTTVLGFDYYNVDDSSTESLVSHTIFAKANVPVIVALSLNEVPEGRYTMAALPLRLAGIEGSPTRVILWR